MAKVILGQLSEITDQDDVGMVVRKAIGLTLNDYLERKGFAKNAGKALAGVVAALTDLLASMELVTYHRVGRSVDPSDLKAVGVRAQIIEVIKKVLDELDTLEEEYLEKDVGNN